MKRLFFTFSLFLFCLGCEKDTFDPDNPDVRKFVQQIKNGTYDCYEKGENGENLWLIMPKFTKDQIQYLIENARDTSHIPAYPFNPMSSRTPFPVGRPYSLLGECLLWSVEGIRNGTGYGSLDPYLIDTTSAIKYSGLKGSEVLIVRDLYQNWWRSYRTGDWKNMNPLQASKFRWQ